MNAEGPMSIVEFCREFYGFDPTPEELEELEELMQARCREKGIAWYRNGEPIMPVEANEDSVEPTRPQDAL